MQESVFRGLRENVVLIVAHNGMFDIIIILFNLISNLIRKIKSFHTKKRDFIKSETSIKPQNIFLFQNKMKMFKSL